MKVGKKVMTLFIAFFLCTSIMLPSKNVQAEFNMNVSAKSAILMDLTSGRVLFEKNANEKLRIASITKIMTAILAIESGKWNDTVTITDTMLKTEGSSIYLQKGQKITLEDLVYGLMLRSGNDAANAIAEYVGGSIDGFVIMMNQKAAEIGMKNTNFDNPSGLDTTNTHLSTAYDMALLTKYAMKNDTYRKVTGTKMYRAKSSSSEWSGIWKNKNKLLTMLYEYSTGGKTGYTKKAGRTLVSTAKKKGMELVVVTIQAPDDWNDHINLFEKGFDTYRMTRIIKSGKVEGVQKKYFKNALYIKKEFLYPLKKGEETEVQLKAEVMGYKKEWKKSVRREFQIGQMDVYLGDVKIGSRPIYYDNQRETFRYRFQELFATMIGVK